MNYEETLNYIHSLPRFFGKPTLSRMRFLMETLGNPQRDLQFIHIAGTNGKGSVSAMTASVLRSAGYKTGLFISPFIINFRERIQINGEYISEEDLIRLSAIVTEAGCSVTEFEFITAVSFLYFKEQCCDVVVLETGLGGRFDATNIIEAPNAAVITGIGLDHTDVLGDTLEKIAYEKCGIIKNGPVFTTYKQPDSAMKVIKEHKNVTVTDEKSLRILKSSFSENRFSYKGEEYSLGLLGPYQTENAVLVIDTLNGCGFKVDKRAMKCGLSQTIFPARLELISEKPTVILDGAHNPHGAFSLIDSVGRLDDKILILGMMRDKNCDAFLSLTASKAKKVITVTVKGNPRSMSAGDLKRAAEKYCTAIAADSYEEALMLAGTDGNIIIAGSLYLASEIRPIALKYYNNI